MKTFLFDLGNVLLGFSHERMIAQVAEVAQIPRAVARSLLIDAGLQWRFERGQLTSDQFHREFERLAECSVSQDEMLLAGSDIFWPNEGVFALLPQLKAAGYRLVLFSNTCWPHFDFVRERYNWLDHFDDAVLSCEVGAAKPEAPMYEAALERIHCEPQECFYTDDIEANVEVGRRFGLTAWTFTGAEDLRRRLAELGVRLA